MAASVSEEDDVERQVVRRKARTIGRGGEVGPVDDDPPALGVEARRGRPLEEAEDGLGDLGEEAVVRRASRRSRARARRRTREPP